MQCLKQRFVDLPISACMSSKWFMSFDFRMGSHIKHVSPHMPSSSKCFSIWQFSFWTCLNWFLKHIVTRDWETWRLLFHSKTQDQSEGWNHEHGKRSTYCNCASQVCSWSLRCSSHVSSRKNKLGKPAFPLPFCASIPNSNQSVVCNPAGQGGFITHHYIRCIPSSQTRLPLTMQLTLHSICSLLFPVEAFFGYVLSSRTGSTWMSQFGFVSSARLWRARALVRVLSGHSTFSEVGRVGVLDFHVIALALSNSHQGWHILVVYRKGKICESGVIWSTSLNAREWIPSWRSKQLMQIMHKVSQSHLG